MSEGYFFHQKMAESPGSTAQKHIQKRGKHHSAWEAQSLVTYFAADFVFTTHEWLIRDDCTPEQIAVFLLDMIRRFEA